MPSSVIRAFGYDPDQRQLAVTFVTGRQYQYRNVPPELYSRMCASFSKGAFFNSHIRNQYPYERIGALISRNSQRNF